MGPYSEMVCKEKKGSADEGPVQRSNGFVHGVYLCSRVLVPLFGGIYGLTRNSSVVLEIKSNGPWKSAEQ